MGPFCSFGFFGVRVCNDVGLTTNTSDDGILNSVCDASFTFDLHWCLDVNVAFFLILVPFFCIFSPIYRTGLVMFADLLYHSLLHNMCIFRSVLCRGVSVHF